jgi:membrane protease YdiL (CAAX protease family)
MQNPNLKLHNENSVSAVLLSAIVLVFVLFLPFQNLNPTALVYVNLVLPQVAYIAAACVYIFAIRKAKFSNLNHYIPIAKPKPVAFLFVFLVTVGAFLAFLIFGVGANYILQALGASREPSLPNYASSAGLLILTLFCVAIMPAVGEEVIFRGLFLTAFKGRGLSQAVLFSSLVFALTHMNPSQLVYQFLFACVLAYITLKTGNILFAAVMHALSNAFVITLPLIIPAFGSLNTFSWVNLGIMAGLAVAGVLILIPSIKMLVKFNPCKSDACYNNQNKQGERKPLGIVFIALLAMLAIMTVLSVFLT